MFKRLRWITPLVLMASGALTANSQTVKLPAEVKVSPGRLAAVTVEYDGDDVRWTVPHELDVFREYDPDPKKIRLRLIGYESGTFHVHAVTCKGGKLSEFATCNVIVGTPPDPGPTPPGPTPPGPNPPGPAPIPGPGFRVLIVYETSELAKLPQAQANVLYSKTISEYLNSKCAMGPDGKTKEWRIYDKDVDASREGKIWQDAMKRARQSIPWIVISTGNGGFEGPLPENIDKTMELLKKYGGA